MELHLHSSADICFVTGAPFAKGDRVASFLVRNEAGEFERYDCLAANEGERQPAGEILCRWVRTFKPPEEVVDEDRELRMTAESLFLSLASESVASGEVDENADLKRFLALMLERKRVLKQRGTDRNRGIVSYEHMPSRQMIGVPDGEMDADFFIKMRDKLDVLLGDPESGGG